MVFSFKKVREMAALLKHCILSRVEKSKMRLSDISLLDFQKHFCIFHPFG